MSKFIGQKIVAAEFIGGDEAEGFGLFVLRFENGRVEISDHGQSCCEHRYMSTDDDISVLVGATLISIVEKAGPVEDEEDDSCSVSEVMFVEIQTNKGFITLVNHNDHNGYYGGFSVYVDDFNA